MPLVMYYFNQVAFVGPLTNLLVVPLVGMLVLPAGLLGIILAPSGALLPGLCWHAAALGLKVVLWIVEHVAQWPFAAATTVTPTVVEISLFFILVGLLFNWKKQKIYGAMLIVLLLAGGLDSAYWTHRRFFNRRMVVTALDVGQGTASVLQLPGGYTVLIDGGGFSDNSTFDVGRRIVAPFLWRSKIRTVDLVVLSHPNSDHLNGLIFILNHFNIGEVWSNHEAEDSQGFRSWQKSIADGGIVHTPFNQLPLNTVYQGVSFQILNPPKKFLQLRKIDPWRDLNNNSLVVRVAFNQVSFLFAGDVEKEAEAELTALQDGRELQSTILFVPHHGARSSCTANFIDAVQPRESVISAGWKNRYKFPNVKTLERLSEVNSRIWRTDLCGAVSIITDGSGYTVLTCRPGCR